MATVDSLIDRYQFHFHLTFDARVPKKQLCTLHETMDKSACPSSGCQSCSLDELNEQQDPFTTAPPQCSTSVVRNASMVHWPGGGSLSIYPHQVLLQLYNLPPWPLPVLLPPLRLPPSLALHKTPCLKQLEMEAVLPYVPQLMLQPLKLTLTTLTTMEMSTLSLASWLTLIPRIYLQGIWIAILFCYLSCLPCAWPPREASGKGGPCFYQLQDHCACSHVQLLHHRDQSAEAVRWSPTGTNLQQQQQK